MFCWMKIKEKGWELKWDLNRFSIGDPLKIRLKLFLMKLENKIKKLESF